MPEDASETEGDNQEHEPVGSELMELAEVLKWQKAVEAANGK